MGERGELATVETDKTPRTERGRRTLRAILDAAATEFGVDEMIFRGVVAPGRERAKRALAHHAERLRGKSIFFMPDSQLEVPLARFLSAELGMELIEVGTPYLHRGHLADDLAALRSAQCCQRQTRNSLARYAQRLV